MKEHTGLGADSFVILLLAKEFVRIYAEMALPLIANI